MTSWWIRVCTVFFGAVLIWLGDGFVATLVFGEGYSLAGHVFRAVTTGALVALMLLLVLRRWPADVGFRPSGWALRRAGLGATAYVVAFSIGGAVILWLSLANLSVDGPSLLPQALAVLALVLMFEAIPEELIFRGYLFAALRERLPVWATILLQAVLFCLFGAIIGAARDLERLLLFFTFSIALGIIRHVTGTVYATIGFHAAFQLLTQLINGEQWTSVVLDDPELWFRDIAFFLMPLVVAPLGIALFARARRRPEAVRRSGS